MVIWNSCPFEPAYPTMQTKSPLLAFQTNFLFFYLRILSELAITSMDNVVPDIMPSLPLILSSKCISVYFTITVNSEFSVAAIRKTFALVGVTCTLVTYNGGNFTAHKMKIGLKSVIYPFMITALHHPQSTELAENFAETLNKNMGSGNVEVLLELERRLDNYELQPESVFMKTMH